MRVSLAIWLFGLFGVTSSVAAQDPPRVRSGGFESALKVDGVLDEVAWARAERIDRFTQTEPAEGEPATTATMVRVIANTASIAIGIECTDDEPNRIVSYSVRRDARLNSEDHVSIVLGPFMDGRSGYVFAVNPSGARYDALIEQGADDANDEWDGIWEASTRRTATGWSAEIVIPIRTISVSPDRRCSTPGRDNRKARALDTASAAAVFN
jgi:hypothetical protein